MVAWRLVRLRTQRFISLFTLLVLLTGLLPIHTEAATGAVANAVGGPVFLTAGAHYALAIAADGTPWYWGSYDKSPQQEPGQTYPWRLSGLNQPSNLVALARAKEYFTHLNPLTLALRSDGTVWSLPERASNWIWHQVIGLSEIKAVAAGEEHYAALKADGTVWTWGVGLQGQLGDGTVPTYREEPGQVPGLADVKAIAAAAGYTVALKADGTVWAWGDNWTGQLGDGTTEDRRTPVQVTGLSGVAAIAANGGSFPHVLALTGDGRVWAWGYNWQAQAGDPQQVGHTVTSPRQVAGLTDVVSIAAADYRSFAVRTDGSVWRWGGWDDQKALISAPVPVDGLPPVVSVVTGPSAAYAQTATGEIWSWGTNKYGELGQAIDRDTKGTLTNYPPGRVQPLKWDLTGPHWPAGATLRAAEVTGTGASLTWDAAEDDMRVAGYSGACSYMLTIVPDSMPATSGKVNGFKPDTTYECSVYAYDLTGNKSAVLKAMITTPADSSPPIWQNGGGGLTARKMTDDSLTLNWVAAIDDVGVTGYRVLQDGTEIATLDGSASDLDVTGLSPGVDYTFEVQARDRRANWTPRGPALVAQPGVHNEKVSLSGRFQYMMVLGPDGSLAPLGLMPAAPTTGLAGVVAAAAMDFSIAVQRPDGSVWWLQGGKDPVHMAAVDGATALSGASGHVLALMPDGTVWGWGANAAGQLGDGTQTDYRVEPMPVPGLTDVQAIAAGDFTSIAVKRDGTVWQWGYLLGTDGNTVPRALAPVKVGGLANITQVAAFDTFALALDKSGKVWAWGKNEFGQVGDGTRTDRTSAVAVKNLTGVVAIAAGPEHGLAVKGDGTVWTWGVTPADSLVPKQVPGLTGARAVAAGYLYSAAVDQNGDVWTWGSPLGRSGDPMVPGKALVPWSDTEAPVWPNRADLQASRVSSTRLTLSWPAASDNRAVTGYRIYRNGALLGTVGGSVTAYDVTNLTATKTYSFQVQAGDGVGNWSTGGPAVTVTTPPVDNSPPALLMDDSGRPALYLAAWRYGTWEIYAPYEVSGTSLKFKTNIGDAYALVGIATEPLLSVWVNGKQVETQSIAPSALTATAPVEERAADDGALPVTKLAAWLSNGSIQGNEFVAYLPATARTSDVFKVEASDYAGNKATLGTASVTYSWAPTITLTEPAAATTYVGATGELTLRGSASADFAGLGAFDEITGEWLDLSYELTAPRQFTVVIRLNPSQPATYRIRLVAIDENNNPSLPDARGRDRRTAIVDPLAPEPPVLASPVFTDGTFQTNKSSLTVTGTTEPGAGVEMTFAGKTSKVTANPKGQFSLKLTLQPGANPLSVTAIDLAGNRSEAAPYTLIYDNAAPQIETAVLQNGDGAEVTVFQKRGTEWVAGVQTDGTYTLNLRVTEPLAGLRLVDGKAAGQVTGAGDQVSVALSGLKAGPNKVTLEVKDAAGNTGRITANLLLDTTGPQLTVKGPTTLLVGAPAEGDRQVAIVTGTANEYLSGFRLVPVGDSSVDDLSLEVTYDQRDARKWTAAISLPADAPATWQFQLIGIDLAGNEGAPAKTVVTLTVDPTAPELSLPNAPAALLLTGKENPEAGVTGGKLVLQGTVTDNNGVKQVMVAGKAVKPKSPTTSFPFPVSLTLAEGKLTECVIYGEDLAGNRTVEARIRAILKTKVTLSSPSATWSSKTKILLIKGTTDKAIRVDDAWVAAVPVQVQVKLGETEVWSGRLEPGSEGYDPAKGTFTLTLPGTNWPPGSYTVTITALPPAEFPTLAPVVKTLNVTIK